MISQANGHGWCRRDPGVGRRPVVAGTQLTAVADRTEASGLGRSETGEPVVTEIRIQTGIDIADASGPAATGRSRNAVNGSC